jgi:diaminohydroxyphosphoribosylaminopyrimidine deaminase / 5-amino-6-(5-phosphoribosylamino)uracil reductase
MAREELYMRRCIDLARLGAGGAPPNPLVGAVLVYNDRIIGEGWHKEFGKAHAEVNALESVKQEDRSYIPESTLYVSLEPCSIFGKTPPCADLIIRNRIPRVVISCIDPTPGVNGLGISRLKAAGIEVKVGLLAGEGALLSLPRRVFVEQNRPYIILKYAQTKDARFCPSDRNRFWITNPLVKRLVHKWRSESDAILVGTQTAVSDNPQLSNRHYFGKSPLRIVIDQKRRLSPTLHLFDRTQPTLVVTSENVPDAGGDNLSFTSIGQGPEFLGELMRRLYLRNIGVLMVEGGVTLLDSFLKAGLWDEARVFIGNKFLSDGIPAPAISANPQRRHRICDDELIVFQNSQ